MNLFRFFPKTTKYSDSKYNQRLSVYQDLLFTTLYSNGLTESGSIMTRIWKIGLKRLLPKIYQPRSVLLLGLAGGSNAHLVRKMYPNTHLTAVEIDPVMVEIGKKHFNLNKIRNFDIVIMDALKFVEGLKTEHYDVVLVDCYLGKIIPPKLTSLKFISQLYQHSDHVLINRIWYNNFRKDSQKFLDRISTEFDFITTETGTNLVISLL